MIALATLVLALGAAPEVAVVKESSTGVSDETITLVLRRISDALQAEGIGVRVIKSGCGADAKCLATIPRDAKLSAALGVTIVRGRRDLTVDIEVVDGAEHELAAQTFGIPYKGEPLPPQAADFFHLLKLSLVPPPASDAPRVVQLEPTVKTPPEGVRAEPGSPLLRAAAVTTIATGAVGLGLLIAAGVTKGQLDSRLYTPPNPTLTRTEAMGQVGVVNGLGVASEVVLAIAGAAAIATGVLWFVDSPSSAAEEPAR